MAVREFANINSDDLVVATGNLSDMTHGTIVGLIERNSIDVAHTWFGAHVAAGGTRLNLGWTQFNDAVWRDDQTQAVISNQGTASIWRLFVVRKALGDTVPRWSLYNYSTVSWSHHNSINSIVDSVAPGTDGDIKFSRQGISQFFDGRVAARAAWSNLLPWAADTTGDAAIEAAGLETAYQNWIDNNPSAAWRFNQSVTTENVVDDTGGGADQLSISGTTVVTNDDPPGFDFSLAQGGGSLVTSISDDARANMLTDRGLTEPQNLSVADLMRLVLEDDLQTLVTETDASAAIHLQRYLIDLRNA